MIRRFIVPGLVLVALGLSTSQAAVAAGPTVPINFIRGTVAGAGFATTNPSAVAVGPDGRVYVADTNGRIQALTLDPNTKAVTAAQQITTSADLQEVFGIAFDPTDVSSPPPIYVTNTVSGFGDAGQAAPGTFPGKITKISGVGYATRTDIITGLPISNSGHEATASRLGPTDGSTSSKGAAQTQGSSIRPPASSS